MLPATEEEVRRVTGYMAREAPDREVTFVQKVYVENVLSQEHAIWDVHTDRDRWWVITNPTNLYSQEHFPNMDLALTFHVGLCLRVPRSEKSKLCDLPVEPLTECFRLLSDAHDALAHARETADFQAIGVRCRETLLAFTAAAVMVAPWTADVEPPKRADLRAWADHICSVVLAGSSQKERRHLFKTLIVEAWQFSNWLTHAKGSNWYDAEAAVTTTENAIGPSTSAIIRHLRGVPEACPACGSSRLSPKRGYRTDDPETVWERPTCDRCGWAGAPVQVTWEAESDDDADRPPPEGECIIPTVPLRSLKRPTS